MKRQTMHQVLPAIIMAGAAAVPIATTVEILSRVPGAGSAIALQPSQPVAVASPNNSAGAGSSTFASAAGARAYQGPVVNDPFGGVKATITLAGKKITGVSISAPQGDAVSASINQRAIPLLQRETLQAQSAKINTVSGATYTSQAYAQSLQAALDQARGQGNAPSTSPATLAAGSGASPALSVSVPGDS